MNVCSGTKNPKSDFLPWCVKLVVNIQGSAATLCRGSPRVMIQQ